VKKSQRNGAQALRSPLCCMLASNAGSRADHCLWRVKLAGSAEAERMHRMLLMQALAKAV
jgi:hypothetical protein